ncbi:MAG: hypothetical protein R2932_27415 [Caldilineaceae bacterium]
MCSNAARDRRYARNWRHGWRRVAHCVVEGVLIGLISWLIVETSRCRPSSFLTNAVGEELLGARRAISFRPMTPFSGSLLW